jgi:hypothetical protein
MMGDERGIESPLRSATRSRMEGSLCAFEEMIRTVLARVYGSAILREYCVVAAGRKEPIMPYRCLADISGPFFDPSKPFRNWSALPFSQLDRATAPYVDLDQLGWAIPHAITQLEHLYAQGYTGIVIDNLAHLVGFERAPSPIYPPNSPERRRAAIYRHAFSALFDAAVQRGMDVFVTTDMQWCTPPLRRYVGRLSADNPRLEAANRWALEELFTTLPQVRGLVVRIGETGGAHDQDAAYTGHMLYTTVRAGRALIDSLLPVCERFGRLLIVRTWSVGIGELGDLLWSPECYRAVFAGYDSPHLLVSIKHGPADFFRLLPPNPTLGLPGPAQIVELQNRREYELFGMAPSAVVPLHQEIVQRAITSNPRFAGVWAWNSSGGWGGGRAALGASGWSVWTELSSALTAALVRTPAMDAPAFVRYWCNERFGCSFGAAVADAYLESAGLIERGWYLGPLNHRARALGPIYLPTLLWVWWMRPTASQLVWAYLTAALGDRDPALREGRSALEQLAGHAERLGELAPSGDAHSAFVVQSVRYLHDAVAAAQAIRTFMLGWFGTARDGRRPDWSTVAAEAAALRSVLDRHRAAWQGNADLPALELDEIEAFIRAVELTPRRLWLQARGTYWLVDRLQLRSPSKRHMRTIGIGAAALLTFVLWVGGRHSASVAGALASCLLAAPLRQRLLHFLLPRLSRRIYLLPSIFFETGPTITEWTA